MREIESEQEVKKSPVDYLEWHAPRTNHFERQEEKEGE